VVFGAIECPPKCAFEQKLAWDNACWKNFITSNFIAARLRFFFENSLKKEFFGMFLKSGEIMRAFRCMRKFPPNGKRLFKDKKIAFPVINFTHHRKKNKDRFYSHAYANTREIWTQGNQPNTFYMKKRVNSHFEKKRHFLRRRIWDRAEEYTASVLHSKPSFPKLWLDWTGFPDVKIFN